jgi:hypothetical protein
MFKVDFIGIGSDKCGSTWIYDNIAAHPEVCDKNLKELNYFSDLYDEHPFSWYQSQFGACGDSLIKGEFSVTYLAHPLAAGRIKKHFPDAKIMAIVRNPVKRAFSNYLHSIRKGDIADSFAFGDYINDEDTLAPGKYADYLKTYYDLFGADKIYVIVLEEFLKDIPAGMKQIYQFIGVKDIGFLPEGYGQANNEAKSYKYLWVENLMVRTYRWLSRSGYTRLVKTILDTGIGTLIRKINGQDKPVPKIDDASKDRLMAYYQSYNAELEQLLGRELAIWK